MRHKERRDGDRYHVVEHLGPGRDERDELVEGVPGEARRTASLGVADGPFRVACRGRGEEDPSDDEDQRCQPEREDRRDTERVVDRRADVPVSRRKERLRAEHTLEPVGSPAPRSRDRHKGDPYGPWRFPTSIRITPLPAIAVPGNLSSRAPTSADPRRLTAGPSLQPWRGLCPEVCHPGSGRVDQRAAGRDCGENRRVGLDRVSRSGVGPESGGYESRGSAARSPASEARKIACARFRAPRF